MELEVLGLTDDVDTDFLILYLESRRLSGGGPVSSYTRTGSQALVTFENLYDAEKVLCKEEHCVQSVTIQVRRPPAWDPGKVALCGLSPEIEECLLELYVEKVSGRDEFVMVRSSDRRSLLITFHEPLSDGEFASLVRSVEKRPVHGSSPSVQRLRLCADVLVENLVGSVSAELLEMYFENRRSGGGRLKSLTMLGNNSAAIVSFCDVSVATRVLSRLHTLQNIQLSVSPYYPAVMGSAEQVRPPVVATREASVIEGANGNEVMQNRQQMDIKTEEKMEEPVKDPVLEKPCEESVRNPVLEKPCEERAGASAATVHEDNTGPCKVENHVKEVTQARPPMGKSWENTEEAEVLMDSSELRFIQEYHHELLAGMGQVTIVPLEVQDKSGFKVSGNPVSCKTAVEILLHVVSSLSSLMVTLQCPGVSLFLLEDEGQRALLETERQHQCVIDTSHLSWKVMDCKPMDPWSFVHVSDTDLFPVQSIMAEELSASPHLSADLEDIKVMASVLKNSPNNENKEEISPTTTELNIKEGDDVDLYTDTPAMDPDEEIDQVCKMSRDEYQDRRLDEEAQLLLAIQMSMDTQVPTMEDEDKDLQRALQLSLRDQVLEEAEEPLQRALEMSLQQRWAYDETSPGLEDEGSGDEMAKSLDTAQIKVLAADETSLVVACAAIKKAVMAKLCSVTLDGIEDFSHKAEILSALEKKHKVTITVYNGQAQIHGFLQNPLRCQEELSQILSALHIDSSSQPGLMSLDTQQTVLIPVSELSEEYNRVVQRFFTTQKEVMSVNHVIQVQKVQNTLLYNQYQLKKRSMLAQHPGTVIEHTLYHGTSESGAKEICHRGFDRSFCGKNATFYGHGVYFAVEAAMSARDRYSPPSSNGHKYILVAQVLTGEFTLGKEDMKKPPIKPERVVDVLQRYDSLVDNLEKPTIFVIFNDTQAYPQYLITCCNTRDSKK